MNVNVDPTFFQKNEISQQVAVIPKVHSFEELEELRQKETESIIEGDVFTYSGVSFRPMALEELANEKIDKDSLNLTYNTTSKNKIDERITVAFRDPSDPEKVMAYKLDKEIVADLKNSFSAYDFFQREDGILRLNNKAEEYLAGWVEDIKINRGYEEADADGNGYISEFESGDLNVAFDRNTDYDYLGEKIVTARSSVGANNYQKFANTSDYEQGGDITNAHVLKFKNTIEKELSHTINLDKDKDGTITLKEGLADYTLKDKNIEETFANRIKWNHDHWVINSDIVLDNKKVETRQIPISDFFDIDMRKRFAVYGTNGERIDDMTMDDMKEFLGEDYAKDSKLDLETIIKNTGVFIVEFDERQKKIPHEITGNKIIDPTTLNPEEHPDIFTRITDKSTFGVKNIELKVLDIKV